MPDAPLIPPAIWQRIAAWLKAGGTGTITLDAHRGTVQTAWINERIGRETDGGVTAAACRANDR